MTVQPLKGFKLSRCPTFFWLLGALKIGLQLLNDGIPSLFSFQRISVDSYRQFVLAVIIVVIDLWLFGHLFAPPAADQRFATARRGVIRCPCALKNQAASAAGPSLGGV